MVARTDTVGLPVCRVGRDGALVVPLAGPGTRKGCASHLLRRAGSVSRVESRPVVAACPLVPPVSLFPASKASQVEATSEVEFETGPDRNGRTRGLKEREKVHGVVAEVGHKRDKRRPRG